MWIITLLLVGIWSITLTSGTGSIRLPHFHFVGVHRQRAKNETRYPVIWVDVPTVDFSSTDIRQRVQHGQSIKYMVPDAVRKFIEEHQLYRE